MLPSNLSLEETLKFLPDSETKRILEEKLEAVFAEIKSLEKDREKLARDYEIMQEAAGNGERLAESIMEVLKWEKDYKKKDLVTKIKECVENSNVEF